MKTEGSIVEAKWSRERASAWYAQQPWLLGCNFVPSTAINQLEMWQADTFDPDTIDRELGWAAGVGFNSMRVFLHDLLWLDDAQGFKDRIARYLEISGKHGISTMFVFFDDCWQDDPHLGKQRDPVPGLHNSGWSKSPGTKAIKDPSQWGRLEDYVSDIVSTFKFDERVVVWDLYNEPGNGFLLSFSLPKVFSYARLLGQLVQYLLLPYSSASLLEQVFIWARAAQPSQPLTTGLWYLRTFLQAKSNQVSLELSDVFSFHSYFDLGVTTRLVEGLRRHGRPLLCTEYLARPAESRFETHLPYFKEQKIGGYNWGLVEGKTQTKYSWESRGGTGEPEVWFHDIFRQDGVPYSPAETELIRSLTGQNAASQPNPVTV
jgi:hypothetical protein